MSQARFEFIKAKRIAHRYFDSLWKWDLQFCPNDYPLWAWQKKCRFNRYRWLAKKLQISNQECHFSNFNHAMCLRAIAICQPEYNKLKEQCLSKTRPSPVRITQECETKNQRLKPSHSRNKTLLKNTAKKVIMR